MDLVIEIEKKLRELDKKIQELKVRGVKYAEAEKNYKVALSQEALKMKLEFDYPVTLIDKAVHGCEAVAGLRFKRDIEKHNYEDTIEEINCLKTRIRVLEMQIKQEYSVTKYQ